MIKSLLLAASFTILTAQISFSQSFTESSLSLGINHQHIDSNLMGGGAVFFDFNNDGWEDIYITGGSNRDQLFENDQTGNFSEVGISKGIGLTANIHTTGVIAGDINNDGFKDLFVTTAKGHHNLLFINNAGTDFSEVGLSADLNDSTWSMSASFGDFDQDGFLDIYCGNYVKYIGMPFYNSIFGGYTNILYRNSQNTSFVDESIPYNMINTGSALATTFTDFDNDSDMDVIVANDFGSLYSGNALYRNNLPNSNFSNIMSTSGINDEMNAMGIAIGDPDEDLDLDYYITNMMENVSHINNANETFTNNAFPSGTQVTNKVSWGTFYFDFDNNTYLDLFVSNGGIMNAALPQPNSLLENQQNGTYSDIATNQGIEDTLRSRGAIYGDIDNDGDLDILVVNTEMNTATGKNISLYKNNTDGTANWVEINLIGETSNRDAYGSHVHLYSNGRVFLREVDGGASFLSHSSSRIHYGLGNYTSIDSVVITWPNGNSQSVSDPAINTIHTITELDFTGLNEFEINEFNIYPNPAKNEITIQSQTDISALTFEILSMEGKLILSGKLNGNAQSTIQLGDLNPGVYLIRLSDDKSARTKKLIIVD